MKLGDTVSMKLKLCVLLALFLFFPTSGYSTNIDWTGYYRAEGVFFKNQNLKGSASEGQENSFMLHHLVLKPEIVPVDNVRIRSRFDIFNNAFSNNQTGQTFGQYQGGQSSNTQAQPPAVLTHHQEDETLRVTELNVNWVHEFSALIIGRVPVDFGLGMTYNSGKDAFVKNEDKILGPQFNAERERFQHGLSTKDMVGFRIQLGNIMFMPAYGKTRESTLWGEDDINNYMVLLNYEDLEKDLSMGFFFDNRVGPKDTTTNPTRGNDFPSSYFSNLGTAAIYDGFQAYNMNFFVKKKTESFRLGAELGFLSGYTGVKVTSGGSDNRVELSGFGGVAEAGYTSGLWDFGLTAGMASGDDPDTANFEGYFFSRNYDVAMMMFNFPLGEPTYDILRTQLAGSRAALTSTDTNASNLSGTDSEVISNAVFFTPSIKYKAGERYEIFTDLTYAMLLKNPVPAATASVSKNLGMEIDFGLKYSPQAKITWTNEIGLLFPGAAFTRGGTAGYTNGFAFAYFTKAAFSF